MFVTSFLAALLEFTDTFLGPLTSKEFDIGRVTFTGKMVSARELSSLLARVDVIAKKHFAGLATLESAGYVPLYVQIIDYVMASQMKSFFLLRSAENNEYLLFMVFFITKT